jgi:hypothetical protein
MKQWFAMLAAVVFLALPAMVSAGEETPIPPEANWSPIPPTPGVLAVTPQRVVDTTQAQASDILRPATVRAKRAPVQLSETEAKYQEVNPTVHDE